MPVIKLQLLQLIPIFLLLQPSILHASETSKLVPSVSLYFREDLADEDYFNSTFAIISNSYPVFDLLCKAPYPIEWVPFYQEEDDGTTETSKTSNTMRFVGNFTIPQTYSFATNLSLQYVGKLFTFANYSCRSVENEKLQTNVILTPKNRKNIIWMNITSDPAYSLYKHDRNDFASRNCNVYATVSDIESYSPCWRCEKPDGSRLELDFISCNNTIECNSIYERQKMGTHCLKVLHNVVTHPNSSRICNRRGWAEEALGDFNPNVLVCKNFGPALAQLSFFGIPKFPNTPPNIYFDWSEVDPNDMIYMHPVKSDLFFGENLTFVCEMSRYYFAHGSWFGIKTIDSTTFVQRDEEIEEDWRGTFVSKLKITLNFKNPFELICYAPVWNSTEWVNASLKLEVRNGTVPKIIRMEANHPNEFTVGQTNRSIVCNFIGKPTPSVTWLGPVGGYFKILGILEIDGSYSSTLVFPEVTASAAGDYKCIVQSFLGSDNKTFTLKIHENSNNAHLIISASVVLVLMLLIIGGLIMFKLYRVIKRQREALRLLTEAEIQEFVDGNPEFLSKNEYLNRNVVIEALPYDKRYEIPPQNLTIDKNNLLGMGAFGKVYTGKLMIKGASLGKHMIKSDSQAIPSEATAKLENSSTTAIVAVKTCGTDVDVMYFKALLSEIKIMAYIGHHKNIVSLLGACTHNIRNRDLCIAVELCPNGSLESFLRRHPNNFDNRVRYGKIVKYGNKQDSEMEKGSPTYCNALQSEIPLDIQLSTIDLLKWTFDIACGMDFLHEKKVIHGDLATRNILLTEDLIAKIGDFGLARQLIECSNYVKKTQCPLPWRHLAPESIRSLEFSLFSDVWAFGITIWEIFAFAEVPYAGMSYDMDFIKKLEHGFRLHKPIYATNDLYEFMHKCWTFVPENRPVKFEEVKSLCIESLKMLRDQENSDDLNYVQVMDEVEKYKSVEDFDGYLVPRMPTN